MQKPSTIENGRSLPLTSASASLPRIAITLGDPAGIGPEVVLKAISNPVLYSAANVTLVGSAVSLKKTLQYLDAQAGLAVDLDRVPILEVDPIPGLDAVVPGAPSSITGEASFQWLNRAITGALQGEFDAVVTAPIAKSIWHQAGHFYPGQTEVLAGRSQSDTFGMMFAARSPQTRWQLRCLLATTHIPLRQVHTDLTPDLMTRKLDLLIDCLRQDFGIVNPKIAIAGLNPHSGEAGKLGKEEKEWLIPWLEEARERYANVTLTGPIPPDTMWVNAGHAWHTDASASPYDAYLALYHDQGLIPVKLLAFDRAVNTTIGLPFVRTSPDHGTAFDIAGRGIARADSMEAAIDLAIDLVNQRKNSALKD